MSGSLQEQLSSIVRANKARVLIEKFRKQQAQEQAFLDSCVYTDFSITNPYLSEEYLAKIQEQDKSKLHLW